MIGPWWYLVQMCGGEGVGFAVAGGHGEQLDDVVDALDAGVLEVVLHELGRVRVDELARALVAVPWGDQVLHLGRDLLGVGEQGVWKGRQDVGHERACALVIHPQPVRHRILQIGLTSATHGRDET